MRTWWNIYTHLKQYIIHWDLGYDIKNVFNTIHEKMWNEAEGFANLILAVAFKSQLDNVISPYACFTYFKNI